MVQLLRAGAFHRGLLALLLTGWVAGPAAAGVLVAPPWVYRSPPWSGDRRASWEALLFAQLEEGDRSWLPRMERLPDGRTRYIYRRRQGQPPLTLPQVQALLRNPPGFQQERRAIMGLLEALGRLGVTVELRPPRLAGAAGEWDPRHRTVRVRPDVPSGGSRDFALVLNHEAIHVAQSCVGGGLRRGPVPLGLPRRLSREAAALLALPLYGRISSRTRRLEEEAFANQEDLSIGRVLLDRHCRVLGTL
jgi:hypothetical protein